MDVKTHGSVSVVGCGAAGMMAAIAAASAGAAVTVFEKNEKAGKKIYITGKGRCNLTTSVPTEDFFEGVVSNPRFLYSSIYGFDPKAVRDWFGERGVKLKEERGNRIFPASDKASDVIRTLTREMERLGVTVRFRTPVEQVMRSDSGVELTLSGGRKESFDAAVISTGGLSYASTGSTGDGYVFARAAGLSVTETLPSLVPLETVEEWCGTLQGLSLKNVELTMHRGRKKLYSGFGEMLFTHFGISGPLVLTASTALPAGTMEDIVLELDLKPALTMEQLDTRLLRDFEANRNRNFSNSLGGLFPARLIPVMASLSGIDPAKRTGEVSKAERLSFAKLIKGVPLHIKRRRGFEEAVITRGGVSVKEIDPGTMEAKGKEGLFFAGEVLDVDAVTGGYNLQIAWSTGMLAGRSAAERAGSVM